ncbi:hypothetical protein PR048_003023 [Dryococelus australis]|uniref:Uncharacterized protein n=1 Tax=Dryococelus australis TaxID=614101 RepID=A0ABQ9ILV7_9NEOP|nr:hypothetical protein PR048_003023 [Dryococelus australis]
MKGRGKRENPEKTRRPTASSGTIPTCENPVTRPESEPRSPWWEASELTARPPRPRYAPTAVRNSLRRATDLCKQLTVFFGYHDPRDQIRSTISTGLHMYYHRERATMAEWLDCSPPTKANWVQFPSGSLRIFKWESCRTMPLVGGFSLGSPVPPCPFIPALIHTHLTSHSSAPKTPIKNRDSDPLGQNHARFGSERGQDKGYTATRIKCAIAAMHKALNWRPVLSHCVYLRDLERTIPSFRDWAVARDSRPRTSPLATSCRTLAANRAAPTALRQPLDAPTYLEFMVSYVQALSICAPVPFAYMICNF